MKKPIVLFEDLGRVPYGAAWDYQEVLLQQNLQIKAALRNDTDGSSVGQTGTTDHLLFVEHPPVYTIGKSGKMEHVLLSEAERAEKGIEFYQTNRGGDITFHGPGQLVGYPILDLEHFYTDIGRYLRALEEVIIRTLAHFGVHAGRSAGETGVWIDASLPGKARKICAMGVRCSRWVTMHGFALNVNTDLAYFDHIVPCGIRNKGVTSLQKELGREIEMKVVAGVLQRAFANVFDVEVQLSGTSPFKYAVH